MLDYSKADSIWEALVPEEHKHQRSQSHPTFHAGPLECITGARDLAMDHTAACAVVPMSLEKTKVPFQETGIIIMSNFNTTNHFPGGSDGKESVCNAGDPGSTPGSGRSAGERPDYPLQYSCLENPHGQMSLAG